MKFEDLIKDEIFNLPIAYSNPSFKETCFALLDNFLDKVEQLTSENLNIRGVSVRGNFVKRIQKHFVRGLKETIIIYYDGRPAEALDHLTRTLRGEKDFTEILKIDEYDVGQSFYRMRIKKENYLLQPLDMFHIPFQMRGKVATQRYSIPGFPSLYLSLTLYASWEEMRRPSITEFQASRLQSTKRIRYLDLTRPIFNEDVKTREIYRYFMTWPLVACCSIKVKNPEDSFKPEYIIPQLLLQWVRSTEMVDGIRYNSTHIDFHKTESRGDFSNLVIPVKHNEEQGHCPELKGMFKMTEPVSWQLKEYATGGQTFIYKREDFRKIDSKISKLELIKGRSYPYSHSTLGAMEYFLDNMEATELK